MQLKQFEVRGLFGHYTHKLTFPMRSEGSKEPSLVFLCGPNGVGKTTLLRMISGIQTSDFGVFRHLPFKSACLEFSDGKSINVCPIKLRKKSVDRFIRVSYDGLVVKLHPERSGPLDLKDIPLVHKFRERLFRATSGMQNEYISTARLQDLYDEQRAREESVRSERIAQENGMRVFPEGRPKRPKREILLAERISKFIRDAQLNSRRFFSTAQPDLFSKIIDRLTEKGQTHDSPESLSTRINALSELDIRSSRFGLNKERWEPKKLLDILKRTGLHAPNDQAYSVINTYVEYLESRAAERSSLVDRLRTFEEVSNAFLKDKVVVVGAEKGLEISTKEKSRLLESHLSSGEYHLLYLLVAAMTTLRRGTVIAIDEPELSMHLEWQRLLMDAILKCASMAQPQLIIATHSPEITAAFSKYCITLG